MFKTIKNFLGKNSTSQATQIAPLADNPERLPEHTLTVLLDNLAACQQDALSSFKKAKAEKSTWLSLEKKTHKAWQAIQASHVKAMLDYVNHDLPANSDIAHADHAYQLFFYGSDIADWPEFTIWHYLRLQAIDAHVRGVQWDILLRPTLRRLMGDMDLLALADAVAITFGQDNAAEKLTRHLSSLYYLTDLDDMADDLIWPLFAKHPKHLDLALGLIPLTAPSQKSHYSHSTALSILARFPHLPEKYQEVVLAIALGNQKEDSTTAQTILNKQDNIDTQIVAALNSKKQDVRTAAAWWLQKRASPLAVDAIKSALKVEKKEAVQNQFLAVLQDLGEDINPFLSPNMLLTEAERGLKNKIPAHFTWFDIKLIPHLTWQNGQTVEPKIAYWWLVLAAKLAAPMANSMLRRYLSLLSTSSQQHFALAVLQAFITQDTLHPSSETALAEAQIEAPNRLQWYRRAAQNEPKIFGRYANYTLEAATADAHKTIMARYIGTAIQSKGILAILCVLDGHDAQETIGQFMKHHPTRKAQIANMLLALSQNDDARVSQMLLSIARNHPMASIQNAANESITALAKRYQWSRNELADKTIPTTGLDENGVLSLDYGQRQFSARLMTDYKWQLQNSEGKIIKALPTVLRDADGQALEDETLIAETQALWKKCQKDSKTIVKAQSLRLYDAMCAMRKWPSSDWQQDFLLHPIMRLLISQVLWLNLDCDGQIIQIFRPSGDGVLLNEQDDAIVLPDNSQVMLAHLAILDTATALLWQQHLKDYKIKPLFKQLSNTMPTLDVHHQDHNSIDDYQGHTSTTFALRNAFKKHGYVRGDVESGTFDYYCKHFAELNIQAIISFSGNHVHEQNIDAILYDLSFVDAKWQSCALSDIPAVLLAECYADYVAIGKSCQGFDENWRDKKPW